MNKEKDYCSFHVPLDLPEKNIMGVISFEVCKNVCIITPTKNRVKFFLQDQQLTTLETDIQYLLKVACL